MMHACERARCRFGSGKLSVRDTLQPCGGLRLAPSAFAACTISPCGLRQPSTLGAMTGRITKELDLKMQEILQQDRRKVSPLSIWGEALAELESWGLAWKEEVHTDALLCHPMNRGKLGVSGPNAHETASRILHAGASLSALAGACCFEMSPTKRAEQVSFNERLVLRSKSLLAPINGHERLLTVGCGHTTAVCRAFNAHCRTSCAKLQQYCTDGKLEIGTVRDPVFRRMVTTGWAWTVISWEAEAAWPLLPDLAQVALNASNGVAATPAEPEIMAAIARIFEGTDQSVDSYDAAVEAASGQAGFIASYIDVIGTFVRLYGGGEGTPMVHFLDEFCQSYGVKLRLGRDFMVEVSKPIGGKEGFPYCRIAVMAVNMCFGKNSDGVVKFLEPKDVAKLRSIGCYEKLVVAESFNQRFWELCQKEVLHGAIAEHMATPVVGKAMCRSALWVLGMGKKSPEVTKYPFFILI